MTWLRPPIARVHASMDTAERTLQTQFNDRLREYLGQCADAGLAQALGGGTLGLVASAVPPEPISLGQFSGWWAQIVDDLEPEIRQIVYRAIRITSDQATTVLAYDALVFYMNNVTDRLVRGLTPPLPQDAFDRIRGSTSTGATEGWTKDEVAQRIAAEMSWETDGPYWRGELGRYNRAIDKILDPIGPPGNRQRELARLNDPHVRNLQAQRANAVSHLDAEKSYWQNRAVRIARTESTGAYNFGTSVALTQEGVACKQWIATRDARTRPEHAKADGQIVRMGHPFMVGGFAMRQPGDFNAPPELVVHCRCAMIGSVECA